MRLSHVLKTTGLILVAAGVALGIYNLVMVVPPDWTVRLSVALVGVGFVTYLAHYLVPRSSSVVPDRPDA